MNLTLEQREELLAAYALNALEPDERAMLEAELAADPELRRELAIYEDALAGIAASTPVVEEPIGHRERMMQKLVALPATTEMSAAEAIPAATAQRAPDPSAMRPRPQYRPQPQPGLWQRIANWFGAPGRISFATAALSLVLVLGMMLWNVNLQGEAAQYRQQASSFQEQVNKVALERNQLQGQMAELRTQVNDLNAQLATANNNAIALQDKLTASQTQLAQLQTAADLLGQNTTLVKPLPGNNNQAFSQLIANPDQHSAVLLAYNLQPIAKDKTYEFWFVDKTGNQIPAGLFSVNESGKGILKVDMPANVPMSDMVVAGVTMEPAGGMPKPTGDMLIAGNL